MENKTEQNKKHETKVEEVRKKAKTNFEQIPLHGRQILLKRVGFYSIL